MSGRNGCGKSTIVKLILRLYEPDSGEILLNGEKIETFSREQIWKLFGVLFQDYAKYPVSVADNIAPGADAGQRAKIAKAEETSELDNVLEKLPQGMDTVLGKIAEDGVDVSGGEWQRIAMARLYYQDAELKILDEPTAAIDPVREPADLPEVFEAVPGYDNDYDYAPAGCNVSLRLDYRD